MRAQSATGTGASGVRRWWGSSQAFTSIAITVAVAVTAVVVLTGASQPSDTYELGDGYAWLASDELGELMLADGSTGAGTARVAIDGAEGGRMRVEHRDGEAYVVVDTPDGTRVLYKLDDARLTSGNTREVSTSQELVRGGDRAYLVDTETGDVEPIDPDTLARSGDTLTFDPTIDAEADGDGRLVVVEQPDAEAFVAIDDTAGEAIDVGTPGDDLAVVAVEDTPAVVNTSDRRVITFRGGRPTQVPLPAVDGELVPPRRSEGDDLVLLARNGSRGSLVVVDVASGRAEVRALAPDIDVSDVDRPIATTDAVFLPTPSSGKVAVIDPDDGATRAVVDHGVGKGGDLQAFVKDRRLWVNNPTGTKAAVIHTDGTNHQIDKYDETIPTITPDLVATPEQPPTEQPTPPAPSDEPDPGNQPGQGGTPGQGPTGPGNGNSGAPVGGGSGPGGGGTGRNGPGGSTTSTTAGPGGSSTTTTSTPAPVGNPPTAPTGFTASAGNRTVDLTWTRPRGPTEYTLTSDPHCDGTDTALTIGGSEQTVRLTGLANGTTYTFELVATNAVGDSPPATAGPVTPTANAPGAPGNVQATANDDGTVTISWDPPAGTGGLTISGYRIDGTTTSPVVVTSDTWTVGAGSTTYRAPIDRNGLDDDAAGDWTFTVTTLADRDGQTRPSNPSSPSPAVDPYIAAPPQWPSGSTLGAWFTAPGGDHTHNLQWPATIPTGRQTTYYVCSEYCGQDPLPTTALSMSIPGREPGRPYHGRVWARNDFGWSAAPLVSGGATSSGTPLIGNRVSGTPPTVSFSITWGSGSRGPGQDSAISTAEVLDWAGAGDSCWISRSWGTRFGTGGPRITQHACTPSAWETQFPLRGSNAAPLPSGQWARAHLIARNAAGVWGCSEVWEWNQGMGDFAPTGTMGC